MVKKSLKDQDSDNLIYKQIALITSIINFIVALILWIKFDGNFIFSSWSSIKKNIIFYIISFLILESILIAVFIVLDLIFFYITFESCLIPMFLIIGTLDFNIISSTDFTFQTQQIIWLGFLLALATKTPMIPFHLWLPEAHTEAPLGGSIILAGILLKLAKFLPDSSSFFTPLILNLATYSIILSSFTTFRQIDLKRMIAYSSIGIFSNTIQGIEGAIILSIMHGIVSPALFICVGLTSKMPIYSLFLFIFILGNMAVPLTGNFVGEFLSFLGIFNKNPLFTVLAGTSMILVAGYSI
ncbi:various chains-domain-containing protein [Piptocephalis cylindrospora]|uniref:Various chains-domain-containing protein n=1 Tax=Piptocephalis cylindrospora TaxID=1907219 RepID=A0A4P9Y4E5_9FUNG|nr:various chains-domain-containing protein [Piptocephalis cylindrospora]|eukprot:RKP13624.1 various chains-domain-containing protein [Piptocephalis cylindrospora]